MKQITIKQYKPAKGGDYDNYELSNGKSYSLWLKQPFNKSDEAQVHIVTGSDKEIGNVTIVKDIQFLTIELNGKKITAKITINQYLRPNKKYFFDKIVKHLLIDNRE